MTSRSFRKAGALLLFSFATILLITGCNNNGITTDSDLKFDQENARRHVMPVSEALKYTARFKQSRRVLDSTIGGNEYFKKNPIKLLNGEYFNRDAIIALLNQAEKGGIRIYLGQDEKGTLKFILVPASEKQDYLKTLVAINEAIKVPGIKNANAAPFQSGEVMERGQECPTMCPDGSPFTEQN